MYLQAHNPSAYSSGSDWEDFLADEIYSLFEYPFDLDHEGLLLLDWLPTCYSFTYDGSGYTGSGESPGLPFTDHGMGLPPDSSGDQASPPGSGALVDNYSGYREHFFYYTIMETITGVRHFEYDGTPMQEAFEVEVVFYNPDPNGLPDGHVGEWGLLEGRFVVGAEQVPFQAFVQYLVDPVYGPGIALLPMILMSEDLLGYVESMNQKEYNRLWALGIDPANPPPDLLNNNPGNAPEGHHPDGRAGEFSQTANPVGLSPEFGQLSGNPDPSAPPAGECISLCRYFNDQDHKKCWRDARTKSRECASVSKRDVAVAVAICLLAVGWSGIGIIKCVAGAAASLYIFLEHCNYVWEMDVDNCKDDYLWGLDYCGTLSPCDEDELEWLERLENIVHRSPSP